MTLADYLDRETRRTFDRPALPLTSQRPVRVERILHEVTNLFGVSRADLLSGTCLGSVVRSRRMACWRLHHELSLSLHQIGLYLRLHHTSVHYHLERVRQLQEARAVPLDPLDDAPDLSGEWAI